MSSERVNAESACAKRRMPTRRRTRVETLNHHRLCTIMAVIVGRWMGEERTVGMTQAQLARRLRTTSNAVHPFVVYLRERGLLSRVPFTREWRPTDAGVRWFEEEAHSYTMLSGLLGYVPEDLTDGMHAVLVAIIDQWDREGHTVGITTTQLSRRLGVRVQTIRRHVRGLKGLSLVTHLNATTDLRPLPRGRTFAIRRTTTEQMAARLTASVARFLESPPGNPTEKDTEDGDVGRSPAITSHHQHPEQSCPSPSKSVAPLFLRSDGRTSSPSSGSALNSA